MTLKGMLRIVSALLLCMASLWQTCSLALGLHDAAEYAFQRDPGLKQSSAQLNSAEYTARGDLAAYLPSISATANVKQTDTDTHLAHASNEKNSSDTSGYGANLSQFIWDGAKHFRYKASKEKVTTAQLKLQKSAQDLLLDVMNAYFATLNQQGQLVTTQRQLTAAEHNNKRIRREWELGSVSKAEVSESDVQLQGARIKRINILTALRKSEQALYTLTGNAQKPDLVFETEQLPKLLSLERPLHTADSIKNNYGLRILRSEQSEQIYSIKTNQQGHWPTLTANINYNNNQNHDEQIGVPKPTGEAETMMYSINLNVPIYMGGSTSSKVKKSQSDYQSSLYAYDDKLYQLQQQLSDVTTEIQFQVSSLAILDDKIKATEDAFNATQRSYEAGTRTYKDVLEAENKVFEALREHTETKYNYINNHFKYLGLLGLLSLKHVDAIESLMSLAIAGIDSAP